MKIATSIEQMSKEYNLPTSLLKLFLNESHGEAVTRINGLAGKFVAPNVSHLEAQVLLIQHEVQELADSVNARDYLTIRDDIADIKFTAEGMATRMGMEHTAEDEAEVVASNLTKFDRTEELALQTKAKYLSKGIETDFIISHVGVPATGETIEMYVTLSSKDQLDNTGKFVPADKWLKSINFVEPIYRDTAYWFVETPSTSGTAQTAVDAGPSAFVEIRFCGQQKLSLNKDCTMWASEDYVAGEVQSLAKASEFIKKYISELEIVPYQNIAYEGYDSDKASMIYSLNMFLEDTTADHLSAIVDGRIMAPTDAYINIFHRQDDFIEISISVLR